MMVILSAAAVFPSPMDPESVTAGILEAILPGAFPCRTAPSFGLQTASAVSHREVPMKQFLKDHRYYALLLYVPVFLIWFVLLETLHPADAPYWVSYLPLDDKIPFLPQFAPIYCLWYPFLIVPGLYLLLREPDAFRRFMWFFMVGTGLCLLICTVFPNGQDLRPQLGEGGGWCVALVRALYAADTNTNVLPSMHVVGSVAVFYGARHSRGLRRPLPFAVITVLTILISLSTVFIKQHSVLDIVTGLALSVPIWLILNAAFRREHCRG